MAFDPNKNKNNPKKIIDDEYPSDEDIPISDIHYLGQKNALIVKYMSFMILDGRAEVPQQPVKYLDVFNNHIDPLIAFLVNSDNHTKVKGYKNGNMNYDQCNQMFSALHEKVKDYAAALGMAKLIDFYDKFENSELNNNSNNKNN